MVVTRSGNCYGGNQKMPLIPMGIVPNILQHVPLTERLTVWALVSKAWADAAAWSTVHVDHAVPPKHFSAFVAWLEQHALRLCSLQLPLEESDLSQLPVLRLPPSLQSLEWLHLQHLSLALAGPQHSTAGHTDSSTAGPVALLPRLHELKLKECELDALDSIVRLTQASSITRLELCCVIFADIDGDPSGLEFFPATPMESVLRVQEAVSDMLRQLPDLQVLRLSHLSLALPGPQHSTAGDGSAAAEHTASSAAGPVALRAVLPRLRELKLKKCSVDALDSIVRLTQSSSITSLELSSVSFADAPEEDVDLFAAEPMEPVLRVQEAVPRMLQQLPDLRVLRLDHDLLCPAAVQQVSAMPRLQELRIEMPYITSDGAAASLPNTLTRLELACRNQDPEDFDDLTQAFPHFLSGLHTLPYLSTMDLSGCTVNPGAISNMPWLQHLRLVECQLLHVLQPDGSSTAEPRVLLECLPKLVHLCHLELAGPSLADSANDAPELFASLTASSHLTCLSLQPEEAQPLPRGAVRHMFKGKKMPQLNVLELGNIELDSDEVADDDDEWCLDTIDLATILSSCRNLTSLFLLRVLRAGADLSSLLMMPSSCHNLTIGELAIDDAAAAILARLFQLERVWMGHVSRLTDAGLNNLTALGELHELSVIYCNGISKELLQDPDDAAIELRRSPEKGSVCEQLKSICLRSPLFHADQ